MYRLNYNCVAPSGFFLPSHSTGFIIVNTSIFEIFCFWRTSQPCSLRAFHGFVCSRNALLLNARCYAIRWDGVYNDERPTTIKCKKNEFFPNSFFSIYFISYCRRYYYHHHHRCRSYDFNNIRKREKQYIYIYWFSDLL